MLTTAQAIHCVKLGYDIYQGDVQYMWDGGDHLRNVSTDERTEIDLLNCELMWSLATPRGESICYFCKNAPLNSDDPDHDCKPCQETFQTGGAFYMFDPVPWSPEPLKQQEVVEQPVVQVPPDHGVKYDDDKLRYDLVPVDALAGVVEVLTFGAKKYGDANWEKGLERKRLYAAVQRHLNSWWGDQDVKDPETGLSHLDHAICGLMMLSAFEKRDIDI